MQYSDGTSSHSYSYYQQQARIERAKMIAKLARDAAGGIAHFAGNLSRIFVQRRSY